MKLYLIFILLLSILFLSCSKHQIDLQYTILRDRVIVTDQVLMKKALYVGFTVVDSNIDLQNAKAEAQLLSNDRLLAESSTISSGERTLNVVFDLPYDIPDGLYTINISVLDKKGDLVLKDSHRIKREDMISIAATKPVAKHTKYQEIPSPIETSDFEPSEQDKKRGFIIFSRSPLEYVFPGSRPKKDEIINQLSSNVCRNEFEPIAFTIYPIQDLGEVTISIDDLKGNSDLIPKEKIKLAFLEEVEQTVGFPAGQFQKRPRLIRPGNKVAINKGECQRFWLTLKIDKEINPGEYRTRLTISPQYGESITIPLTVTISPIILEDIPNVAYFMLMTYEFTELTMPWSDRDKKKIYDSAFRILQDYKNHGMTTLCVHSPFIHITKEDGSTNLDDIFATLTAARDIGFKRPIIWYMGHLIQTAKPKHPGNILGFDESIHIPRLQNLVKSVSQFAKDNDCPDVIFLPIDEADDSYQDPDGKRHKITPLLLETIKSSGHKSMLTSADYEMFKPLNYFCSSKLDIDQINKAHLNKAIYWFYNNQVTTNCISPAYARFIYGYFTWISGIDGMSSWTFQNTQNAAGDPPKADAPGKDIFLAYPHPDGPLSTLEWEAVREGIDDHKLIYQLEKRIQSLAQKGINSTLKTQNPSPLLSESEAELQKIRNSISTMLFDKKSNSDGNKIPYKKYKEEIISTIMEIENQ